MVLEGYIMALEFMILAILLIIIYILLLLIFKKYFSDKLILERKQISVFFGFLFQLLFYRQFTCF
jgi:hypothetical protein